MSGRKARSLKDPRVRSVIEELKGMVLARYPDASFEVVRDIDDPTIIWLDTTVEVEDRDEVKDLVSDRELEILEGEDFAVYVSPRRR